MPPSSHSSASSALRLRNELFSPRGNERAFTAREDEPARITQTHRVKEERADRISPQALKTDLEGNLLENATDQGQVGTTPQGDQDDDDLEVNGEDDGSLPAEDLSTGNMMPNKDDNNHEDDVEDDDGDDHYDGDENSNPGDKD